MGGAHTGEEALHGLPMEGRNFQECTWLGVLASFPAISKNAKMGTTCC